MGDVRRRVLLVDDEPSIVKVVGKQLEVAGFDVLVAMDGEEGLTKALIERPDVIILDLMMPKRSGLDVCAALRQDERCKQTPIILYSGKGDEDVLMSFERDEQRVRKWGADAFVAKSRGTVVLIQQIRTLLGEATS